MTSLVQRAHVGPRWARLLPVLGLFALGGCEKTSPERPGWVISARVAFLSMDLDMERPPLPLAQFRVFFPYIAGDIYGSPTTGDFINPVIGADYRFQIDLNRSHKSLLASLEPTEFSVRYLHIEPARARVARLAPMVLEADGIDPVGRTNWVDADSRRVLLLLYLDRAATISGQGTAGGRPLRYAIRTTGPGYVWVGQQPGAAGNVYTVLPEPANLLLAVTPLTDDHPTVALPSRTDTPAQ